jgi:hypothetical protein
MAVTMLWLASPLAAIAGSQYIVIKSEPALDAFPPGKIFVLNDVLAVPEGATVTLLGEDGTVTALPGPAQVLVTADAAPGAAAPDPAKLEQNRSTLSKIGGLLRGEQGRTETLGVSRSIASGKKPQGLDDPWALSADQSGPGCYRNESAVLARKDDKAAAKVSLRIDGGDPVTGLVWQAGEASLALPQPVPDGARRLMVEVGSAFASIDLHALPAGIDEKDPLQLVGWMIEKGCQRQAAAFLGQLAAEAQ